jgi:hypothetical protein
MIRFIAIVLFLALATSITHAQSEFVFVVGPGIKIGSASGDAGGFLLGFEVSAGFWNEELIAAGAGGTYFGTVIDYDFTFNGRGKLHVGGEAAIGPAGIDVGPTLVFENGGSRLATTVTGWVWLVATPFYSVTLGSGNVPSITDWGAYLKGPYRPDGERLVDWFSD